MGELFLMNQPRRRSPLPATLGILGSSKGNTYVPPEVGSGSAQPQPGVGTGQPAPAVGPVDANQVASVLNTLNTISNPEPPQKITATGEAIPGAAWKASTLPRWVRPSPPPVVYVQPPPVYVAPAVAPGPPFPGGGGGGGGAAAGDEGAAGGEAPVFLGLTQKQLVIGGALAVGAFLLLRKKKRHGAAEGV